MSQGWNRQLQNMQRLMNEYANAFNLKEQGFQLGEAGNMKTGKTVPKVIPSTQPTMQQAQQLLTGGKVPLLTTSGKPLPDITLGKGIPVNQWAGGGYQWAKPGLIKNAVQPIKGLGGPVSLGMLLAPLWYGKDKKYGTTGPGRLVLENTIFKKNQITPEMIKGKEATEEWLRKKFGLQGKSNNNVANTNMPPSESLEFSEIDIPEGNISIPTNSSNSKPVSTHTPNNAILPEELTEAPESNQFNIQAINDYIQQLKDINQPYSDALQNYINNYDDLYKRNYNAQRYWAAMSGLAKNPNYRNVAEAYNPLVQEANRLNAIKQLQQQQASDINAINEIMGNLAVAKEIGLEPEAAFANKNLLTALSMKDREENKLRIALENNLVKKYGIDKNYAKALAQQALRNQGALNVALTNAAAFGGLGGYQPITNMQPAPGLTPQGTAQTQSKNQAIENFFQKYGQ